VRVASDAGPSDEAADASRIDAPMNPQDGPAADGTMTVDARTPDVQETSVDVQLPDASRDASIDAGTAASVFVATTGSDSNPCTRASPCQTFDRAYRAAMPGQVVEVAAGSYAYQRIARDASKTATARVVFRPAAGATVTMPSLELGQTPYGASGTPRATS
jgi:hypothetical protein